MLHLCYALAGGPDDSAHKVLMHLDFNLRVQRTELGRSRSYYLWFRFRLFTSYGSGYGSSLQFSIKILEKNLAFLHSKNFYKEKFVSFIKFSVKCE